MACAYVRELIERLTGMKAEPDSGADVRAAPGVRDNRVMAFFRSRTLLVSVGVITIVALSLSMAVMFI